MNGGEGAGVHVDGQGEIVGDNTSNTRPFFVFLQHRITLVCMDSDMMVELMSCVCVCNVH